MNARKQTCPTSYPSTKLAAVLVLLFERAGELRVLLTTRSKSLRSHPGQTALPGGKVDPTDVDIIATAFREANEEVGLPLDCPDIYTLCLLRPFLSSSKLFVTPVVAFLTEPSVLEDLKANPTEVDCIFSHPLEAILDPSIARKEPLVPIGSEHWPYEVELHSTTDTVLSWLNDATYRMHRFRSSASPIKGLTSEILTATAEIAFARPPTYERYAGGQIKEFAMLYRTLKDAGISSQTLTAASTPASGAVTPV
ncbi:hypothetical protein OE88DRAFT_1662001 [Heliocybe sulcata]|uniref:Nudix hydrolase domain-containing protein n=1 Tax=Heliocybe sulcata TaxID=5364 RepID=A0A5C3N6X0_9AGAM|nr:hypothetical protein OE88DRAFT_1662001 [Heliocybe sulcata]